MSGIISRNRGMYKNQLQELAQRSCFNLPSYSCIREGPDHAPQFKATVNFNGETFESPTFCTTLRQAEHAAAEVALNELAKRGPSRALAARVLDESGVYKNLLQETAHRAGLNLPVYTTVRSGPGHVPVFSCTVELAGMSFMGEPAKTKKQAQKNAAMAAWSGLKQMSHLGSSPSSSSYPSSTSEGNDEQEQVIVARVLASLRPAEPNKLTRKNRQHSRLRSSTLCTDLNPLGGARSFQPMQYQGWSYPNFSSGVAMYQMWQQQQTAPQQSHCLTLPVPPTSPPGPQILPFIRSMFQPDQRNYFPAREQMPIPMVSGITMSAAVPSLYVSNPLMPVQVRGVGPQVTIQEIQEIGDPDHLNASTLSNASGFSQFEASKSQVSVDDHSAIVTQKTLREEKERRGSSEIKIEKSVQLGGSQPGRIEGSSPRDMGNGYRPIAANPGHIEFMSHNPTGSEPSWSSYRPYYPSSLSSAAVNKGFGLSYSAASNMLVTSQPVATLVSQTEGSNIWSSVPVRTGAYSLPSIQKPAVTNSCGRLNPMMAPAVQIRTVVPVCTAAAPSNKPGTSHEGCFPGGDEGNVGVEDVTAGSLGLDKLRI